MPKRSAFGVIRQVDHGPGACIPLTHSCAAAAHRTQLLAGHATAPTPQEWLKDHRLFVATLEELAGQLATLQPQQQAQSSASQPPKRATAGSGSSGDGDERKQLLDRLLKQAPSERLRAYVEGRAPAGRLQRTLPEQLDQNMRLLSILAAEMRVLVQRLEQMADAAAAPVAVQGSSAASDGADASVAGSAAGSPADGIAAAAGQDPGRPPAAAHVANAEEALVLAAVADGAAKETLLVVSVQWCCGVAMCGSACNPWHVQLLLWRPAARRSHQSVPAGCPTVYRQTRRQRSP